MAHARLSPSGAARWSTCVAAPAVCQHLDRPSGGKDALEGTLAHELAASLLMTPARIRRRVEDGLSVPRPADQVRAALSEAGFDAVAVESDVLAYVDLVRTLPGYLVEMPLPLEPVTGEAASYGTCDACAVGGDDEGVWVVDLKMGRNPVDAKDNPQLLLYAGALVYALATSDVPGDMPVHLAIVQPRTGGSAVDQWDTTWRHVKEAIDALRAAGQTALALMGRPQDIRPGHFQPSAKACRYCPAAGACRALASASLELLGSDPGKASADALAEAWRAVPMVKAWAEAVGAEVERRLSAGVPVPGLALGRGKQGNRQWTSEALAAEWAEKRWGGAAYAPRKLLSPAQLEKLAKGDDAALAELSGMTFRAPGKVVVVEADSPRAGLGLDESAFPDETAAVAAPTGAEKAAGVESTAPAAETPKKAARKPRKRKQEDVAPAAEAIGADDAGALPLGFAPVKDAVAVVADGGNDEKAEEAGKVE